MAYWGPDCDRTHLGGFSVTTDNWMAPSIDDQGLLASTHEP